MLDKNSKIVLEYILENHTDDLSKGIDMKSDDFIDLNINHSKLYAICYHLFQNKLLDNVECDDVSKTVTAFLSYKGLQHFKSEKDKNKTFIKQSILVPVFVTLLTQLLIFLLKLLSSLIL